MGQLAVHGGRVKEEFEQLIYVYLPNGWGLGHIAVKSLPQMCNGQAIITESMWVITVIQHLIH